MALLTQVLRRNLQFDRDVALRYGSKEWRRRLADLEVDGAVLDLDDDVVVELAV